METSGRNGNVFRLNGDTGRVHAGQVIDSAGQPRLRIIFRIDGSLVRCVDG